MRCWLDEAVKEANRGAPITFICRTSATSRALYRRLAQEASAGGPRGYAHVQVTTLAGLCAAANSFSLSPEAESGSEGDAAGGLPEGHPWQALLASRPALRRELRELLGHAHACALAGADLSSLSPPLRELVQAGWGAAAELQGVRRILGRRWSPLGPVRPEDPSFAHDCVAVGFGDGRFDFLGGVSLPDRAVLAALGARFLDEGDPLQAKPGPLPALLLPDIAAEARAVARQARADRHVLVLLPDALAEERIRAALERNGVPVSDDAASPLSRHSLATVLVPLLPVFASKGEAPLSAKDLLRLLTDPVLSRRAPQGVVVPPPDGDQYARASVRHLRELITGARRARATLAGWEEATAAVEAELAGEAPAKEEERRAGAQRRLASVRVLRAQLAVMRRCAGGEGRLGNLAELVCALRLSDKEDVLGAAIVRALEDEAHRPAEPDAYQEALSGSAGSRRVGRGVELLAYGNYDGRACDQLFLTGVHDKGLGKVPAPSTFLTNDDREVLGLPRPADAVRGRLALARWAATRAKEVVALVTHTDASGRRVSPPVELELAFDDRWARASHGLGFELPERQDARALEQGAAGQDDLCLQLDAEWARAGAVFAPFEPLPELDLNVAPLTEVLERREPKVPVALRPWLGEVGALPGQSSGLPEGFGLSASRLQAFTNCLFRAFAQSVLRLKPLEEVEEDLDAREVGNAVHRALQEATGGIFFRVPEQKLEAAREKLVELLHRATGKAIAEEAALRPAGADSEPLQVAREGLSRRWSGHWRTYAHSRVQSVEEANEAVAKQALKALAEAPGLDGAAALLSEGLARTQAEKLLPNLRAALASAQGVAEAVLSNEERLIKGLTGKNQELVCSRLKSHRKELLGFLEAVCAPVAGALEAGGFCAKGDLEVVAGELGFGAFAKRPLSLSLGLDEQAVPVQGAIDAILLHRGRGSAVGTRYRVVDFKTGSAPGKPADVLESVIRPQLPFYALVLEALGPVAKEHPGPVGVNAVAYDMVRNGPADHWEVTAEVLGRIRGLLGQLLDRARAGQYPPVPHPGTCPVMTERGAYCDFADLCRVRPSAGSEAAL